MGILILLFAVSLAFPQDVYRKAREKVRMEVETQYLRTKEALRKLKRELKLRRKKEKMRDALEDKKGYLFKEMLKHSPAVKLNVQGVVGEYAIVDGYALPSGTKTPYGRVKVVGPTVFLDSSLVFPPMEGDYSEFKEYVEAIESILYYRDIPATSGDTSTPLISPPP